MIFQTDDGEDDLKKGTQLLEIYALEIQMYTAQKNNKKLKALYEQSLHIKSAIPHPLIMGVIRGKLISGWTCRSWKANLENLDNWERVLKLFWWRGKSVRLLEIEYYVKFMNDFYLNEDRFFLYISHILIYDNIKSVPLGFLDYACFVKQYHT